MAAVDPYGFPNHVAANELIESAWGNAVVDHTKFYKSGAVEIAPTLTATSAGFRVAFDMRGQADLAAVGFATVMMAWMSLGYAGDTSAIRAGARLTRASDNNPGVEGQLATTPAGDWRYFFFTREWPVPANITAGYTGDLNVVGSGMVGAIYVQGQTTWQRRKA